jgi:hypothetical protein
VATSAQLQTEEPSHTLIAASTASTTHGKYLERRKPWGTTIV